MHLIRNKSRFLKAIQNNEMDIVAFYAPAEIMEGIKHGHIELVKDYITDYLLLLGGDISFETDDFETLGTQAAFYGQIEMLDYILKKGFIENKVDCSIFVSAVKGNQFEVVKYWVEHHHVSSQEIEEALTEASRKYLPEMMTYLIEKGADVNYMDGRALTTAVEAHQLESVKLLVEHGASITIDNYYAFFTAIQNNEIEIVQYFLEQGIDLNLTSQMKSIPDLMKEWINKYKNMEKIRRDLTYNLPIQKLNDTNKL